MIVTNTPAPDLALTNLAYCSASDLQNYAVPGTKLFLALVGDSFVLSLSYPFHMFTFTSIVFNFRILILFSLIFSPFSCLHIVFYGVLISNELWCIYAFDQRSLVWWGLKLVLRLICGSFCVCDHQLCCFEVTKDYYVFLEQNHCVLYENFDICGTARIILFITAFFICSIIQRC